MLYNLIDKRMKGRYYEWKRVCIKSVRRSKIKKSGEKEFLDAVTEVLNSLAPVFDKHPEFIEAGLLERIVEPERQIYV